VGAQALASKTGPALGFGTFPPQTALP